MQKNDGAIVFSAGDLVGHLNCRYLTHLDLKVVRGELAKPGLRDDPALDALVERGKAHELGFVNHLAEQSERATVIAGRWDRSDLSYPNTAGDGAWRCGDRPGGVAEWALERAR